MDDTSEYRRFLTKENFLLAWKRIRNSTKIEVKDRLSLKIFSATLDAHLDMLMAEIETEKYVPTPAAFMYVPKKSRTLRPLAFLAMRDRLVYQALGNIIITNAFEDLQRFADKNVFSPVLVANPSSEFPFKRPRDSEKELGQYTKFVNAIEQAHAQSEIYSHFVKTDIAAFYPSTDHNLLLQTLERHNWLTNPYLLRLLLSCLGSWATQDSGYPLSRGLPIGYETSDVLASLFLFEVDEYVRGICYLLRYVDDMYLFTNSRGAANHALSQMDVLLQIRGLNMQTAKVKIRPNTGEEESAHTIQSTIMHQTEFMQIDYDLSNDSMGKSQETDEELKQLLQQILDPNDFSEYGAVPQEAFEGEDALIAFVFYRLREKEEWLKNAALRLLDELPSRSFALTKYLSLFHEDDDVIEALWSIVLAPSYFSQVRVNCIRALLQISEDKELIWHTAQEWCKEHDWLLRITGIEILQNQAQYAHFLREIAEQETEDHAKASAFAASFRLLANGSEKMELLSIMLQDESYLVPSLGVYLWLHETTIPWQSVSPGVDSTLIKRLMQTELAFRRSSFLVFNQSLMRLFGFVLSEEFPLLAFFEDVEYINQLLIDIDLAQETNVNTVVEALSGFTRHLALGSVKLIGKNLADLLPASLLRTITRFAGNVPALPELASTASILSGSGIAMPVRDIGRYIRRLSAAYAFVFYAAHRAMNIVIPPELETAFQNCLNDLNQAGSELSDENGQPSGAQSAHIVEIFFSYAHEDNKWRDRLKKHLAVLENTGKVRLWSDRQIPAGGHWEQIIDEKLTAADIVLFLLSADFMASKYIQQIEVEIAVKRETAGECAVIPVIMRPVKWNVSPYKEFQALPENAKPVSRWPDMDSALVNVVEGIENIVDKIIRGDM